jgi:hypothetical protein
VVCSQGGRQQSGRGGEYERPGFRIAGRHAG